MTIPPQRRTRILATLGPASREPEVLDRLFAAGLDAVRLNFSHGTHEAHAETYRRVREISAKRSRDVAVLQDLQGPKIRLGKLAKDIEVVPGATLTITTRKIVGEGNLVPTDHDALAKDVRPGMKITLDEGRVTVVVRAVEKDDVITEVIDGGTLASHKGLSIPGATLTTKCITEKDVADLRFGLAMGADFVALSFVRSAADILELRNLMKELGREVPIIAKIERLEAVEAIDAIVAAADGVMVARGDLALEAPLPMLPAYQKKIIARANHAGKLVITATQMLESMTTNPLPTRAEVTDVANAILDGSDAVMLSGETSVGKYPVETVAQMSAIALATEETLYPFERSIRPAPEKTDPLGRVTARAAAGAARDSGAKAIVVFTQSGRAPADLSDERPHAPILAFCGDEQTRRRLALYWGVQTVVRPLTGSVPQLMALAEAWVLEQKIAAAGDRIVFVLGAEIATGTAHSVRIVELTGSPRA